MTTNQIIKSGFIKAFLTDYFNTEVYISQPERIRLIFSLYRLKAERENVVINEIEELKKEILKMKVRDLQVLAYEYIASCDEKSKNFVTPFERNAHWLNEFAKYYAKRNPSFTLFLGQFEKFTKGKSGKNQVELESNFLNLYWNLMPKETDLTIVKIKEKELINELKAIIDNYQKTSSWDIDIQKFRYYINYSVAIYNLFAAADLLVISFKLASWGRILANVRNPQSLIFKNSDSTEKEININPYPKIFSSYIGFKIFDKFVKEIVNEKTEYADFSFLFYSLLKDDFIHDIGHKKFIDFLGKEYKVKFAADYNQFKFCNTDYKIKAYSRIKREFQ
jgi:hypothetical protein